MVTVTIIICVGDENITSKEFIQILSLDYLLIKKQITLSLFEDYIVREREKTIRNQ